MKKIYPRTRILAGVGVAVIFAYIALAAYVAALVLVEHLLRRPLGWQVASGILVVVLLVQSVFAGIINALCWKGELPPPSQRLGSALLCFGLIWIVPCYYTAGFILFFAFLWLPLFALGVRFGMKLWYGGLLRQYLGQELPEPKTGKIKVQKF